MRRRDLMDFQQLPPFGHGLSGRLAVVLLRPAFQRDASLFRELFKRFLEIQPVDLPVKIEQISGSLTTETIKKTFFLVDGKRGLGFLVKRTRRYPARPIAFQVHVPSGNVHQIQARLDFLNGSCVPSHTLLYASGGKGRMAPMPVKLIIQCSRPPHQPGRSLRLCPGKTSPRPSSWSTPQSGLSKISRRFRSPSHIKQDLPQSNPFFFL